MSLKLVNPDSALANADSDHILVRELAQVFVDSSQELLDDLLASLQSGDKDTLARTAHTLKSPLGFFGADATLELALTVEQEADAGNEDGLAELVDQLCKDVRQVRQEVRSFYE